MKTRFLLAALSILVFNGCATKGDIDVTRNDIDAMRTRLFSVERDLGGLRSESKEGLGTVEKTFRADVASVRKISADIQATIDGTKNELQSMNGKIDEMAAGVKKPTEELNRYRIDADKRIIAIEDRVLKLQSAIDELSRKMSGMAQKLETPPTPDSMYQKALETYKAGDMPAARELFGKFVEQNPQHDLAANAHYWIGETHYSEKNFEPAILSFQDVIKNFPNSDKVPAAMFKQALAFQSINDVKSSKYVLKKLIDGYPKSEEAKKAKALSK